MQVEIEIDLKCLDYSSTNCEFKFNQLSHSLIQLGKIFIQLIIITLTTN